MVEFKASSTLKLIVTALVGHAYGRKVPLLAQNSPSSLDTVAYYQLNLANPALIMGLELARQILVELGF